MSDNAKIDLQATIGNFVDNENALAAIRVIMDIFKSNPDLVNDRDNIMPLLDNCTDKSPMLIRPVARIAQHHIRHSVGVKKAASEILHEITGMEDTSFYDPKARKISYDGSNKELSSKDLARLQLVHIMFLEKDQEVTKESLGVKWDAATRITFAEDSYLTGNDICSLARWHVKLATSCKNTLTPKQANIILNNVSAANELLFQEEGHTMYVPSHLYEAANKVVPEYDIHTPSIH